MAGQPEGRLPGRTGIRVFRHPGGGGIHHHRGGQSDAGTVYICRISDFVGVSGRAAGHGVRGSRFDGAGCGSPHRRIRDRVFICSGIFSRDLPAHHGALQGGQADQVHSAVCHDRIRGFAGHHHLHVPDQECAGRRIDHVCAGGSRDRHRLFVPSTLIAIIVVTAASVFLGLTTTSIGDMGNMTAALPDVHLPTLLLSLETWKIVLPYSISLAFVGLIETLLTQQVVDQMTETTSDTNRESCSQGITNMVCGCIGGMPGCAMIGQAIVNVKSGGRGRLSTLVAGVMLIAVLGFGSGLLNIIPLAALIGVMITVSIATFDWDSLRSLKDQSPLEILTTLLTVVIVVATNNLAYGVAAGLALYYAGGFAAKAFVRAS